MNVRNHALHAGKLSIAISISTVLSGCECFFNFYLMPLVFVQDMVCCHSIRLSA